MLCIFYFGILGADEWLIVTLCAECGMCARVWGNISHFARHRTHIFNEREEEQSLQLLCFAGGTFWPLASHPEWATFFLNMYLTIISDLSLAETKTSLLSLPLSTLRNMKAIHYLYCSRCGVEWRKKVKENLFWTEHYLFMVHEAWAAWSAAQKGILHSNIFLKSPGTFIYFCGALLCILLPLEWFLSQAAGCVCFGAW
jgi:hypothetical protein